MALIFVNSAREASVKICVICGTPEHPLNEQKRLEIGQPGRNAFLFLQKSDTFNAEVQPANLTRIQQ